MLRSTAMPSNPTTAGAMAVPTSTPKPAEFSRNQATKAPIMYCAPWAKLMILRRPKMTASPRLNIA